MDESRLAGGFGLDGDAGRLLADSAAEMLFALDADGRIAGASSAVARTLGFAAADLAGRPFATLIHPEDAHGFRRALEALTRAPGRLAVPEARWLHRDGAVRRVECVATRPDSAGAEGLRIAVAARDVTDHRRLVSDLVEARKARAVGATAVGVAHDLNNLVTAIMGHCELTLGLIAQDDPIRRHVSDVARAAERAASLTRQLLAFSRRRVLQPRALDLGEVVDHMEDLLRRILGEHVELRVRREGGPAFVLGDPAEIEQLIADTAICAREDLPSGGFFEIVVRPTEIAEPLEAAGLSAGPYVELVLERSGPTSRTSAAGDAWSGAAIGLARELARRQAGTARLDSPHAGLTRLEVLLPRLGAPHEPGATDDRGPRGWQTVLVAEDEVEVRGLVREMLTSLGYEVLEAEDAEDALATAAKHHGRIHLLVADVVMPGASGPELARRLAALHPEMKVLLMSGYPDAVLDEGDPPLGPALLKPFSRRTLARRVRDLLDRA
jgi:two-component system, cell cycle sensor histidine kinase and response regulator CckA